MASPYDPGVYPPARGGPAKPVKKKGKGKGKGGVAGAMGLFPVAGISPQEFAATLAASRRQVGSIYNAAPMPSLQTYQQPFIDAATHEAKLGTDLLAAIGASAQTSQAYQQGLTSAIQGIANQTQGQTAASLGPGAPIVPAYTSAEATALPAQSMGTSQTQYLNALAPYAAGSGQEYLRNIDQQQRVAVRDYNKQVADRSSQQIKDVQDLYGTNIKAMQDSRQNLVKNAIAEYIALTTQGYKAKTAAEIVRRDTQTNLRGIRANEIAQENADAHQTSAAASQYRATHPSKSGGVSPTSAANNQTQAWKDFLKIWQPGRTKTNVASYTHKVKLSYQGKANALGQGGGPRPLTIDITTPDQDPASKSLTDQVNQWMHEHRNQYPGLSFVSADSGTGNTVTGYSRAYGPGLAHIWQQAINAYAAHFAPKAGETEAQFRKRIVAAVSVRYPRPKGA